MTHIGAIARAIATTATLAGGLGLASAAQAAPLTPAGLGATDGGLIERVAGGCGPGFHPNPWGVCRPNGYGYGPRRFYGGPYGYGPPRPVYRPYGFYGPRPYY